ncbi:hypothetical protein SVAN01_02140 [Stagonosporopsis vannaccii]|nr:hypothetical protein SVAN01_02140 [Stagonosporopsis vannaccii]
MASSWAGKVAEAQKPKPPTPDDRLSALADFYSTLTPKTILEEALGKINPVLPQTPGIAKPLVEHTIVVCVDTESHTLNTDQMTELGINYISRKTAKQIGHPGPHGYKLQEALKFFHFRVVEHAHLKSNRVDSLGPLGNRFGHTRFSTFLELRVILDHLFNQEIATNDPELKGCKCPIVLVGHALKHDTENTNKKGFEYNIDSNTTIVAKVDTQALAREVELWVPPANMSTNEIGLRTMIEKLGFKHLDDHTACNDAARTMMCAIYMVLPKELQNIAHPTMQLVADRVEERSKGTSPAPFGTEHCCIRCGGRNHSADTCKITVHCAACERFDAGTDREPSIASHIETYCPHVAKFKAWARRYRDAAAKNRAPTDEIRAGPGSDGHPWSTWPMSVKWPLLELKEVLVGFSMIRHDQSLREPPAEVQNLTSALGGLPVPSTGSWFQMAPVASGVPLAIGSGSRSTTVGSSSSAYSPPPVPAGAAAVRSPVTAARSPATAAHSPVTAARSPVTAARSPALATRTLVSTPSPVAGARCPAPTAAVSAQIETTMSEQRERARRTVEEKKFGSIGDPAGCDGSPRKPGSGGTSGGAAAGGSWW